MWNSFGAGLGRPGSGERVIPGFQHVLGVVKARFHPVRGLGAEGGLLDLEEELGVALGLAHLLHEELQGLLGL
jgi:hypothetical protein